MEPVHTLKNGIPVELGGIGLLDGGVGPVIDADAAALGSALFIEIDAYTVTAADDFGGVHTVAAQGVDCSLTDGVGGQLGHIDGIHAVVGQRHGNVGFTAAEGKLHVVTLDKTLIVVGLQAEHQLAEGYDLCHYPLASLTISTDFLHSAVISSQAPASISLSGHM